jgi:hypothetical protein
MTTQTKPTANGQPHEPPEEASLLDGVLERTQGSLDRRESALIGMQLDTSHKRPRSIKAFLNKATEYATLDADTAASCSYAVPRAGKTIVGPSVRLAEICAMAWGNIHVDAHVEDIGETFVKVNATAWDMESNNRFGVPVARRITQKDGRRFSDDMIITTINAASSIAIRNAVFRVIPKALVEQVRQKCVAVVRGDISTLSARRAEALRVWATRGITEKRILATLGRKGVEDIDLDDLVTLLAFWQSVKEGRATPDECFASPLPEERGRLGNTGRATAEAHEEFKREDEAKREATVAEAPDREPGDEPDAGPNDAEKAELHRKELIGIVRSELKRTGYRDNWALSKVAPCKSLDALTAGQASKLIEDLAAKK